MASVGVGVLLTDAFLHLVKLQTGNVDVAVLRLMKLTSVYPNAEVPNRRCGCCSASFDEANKRLSQC